MSRRKRLADGFLALNRGAFTEFVKSVKPGPGWLFLRLLLEADHKTGTIATTYRQLARDLGYKRVDTLRRHLKVLEDLGEVEVTGKARNQHEQTVVSLPRYFTLQGAVSPGVTETVAPLSGAVTVGGSESVTANPLSPAGTRPKKSRIEEDKKVSPSASSEPRGTCPVCGEKASGTCKRDSCRDAKVILDPEPIEAFSDALATDEEVASRG